MTLDAHDRSTWRTDGYRYKIRQGGKPDYVRKPSRVASLLLSFHSFSDGWFRLPACMQIALDAVLCRVRMLSSSELQSSKVFVHTQEHERIMDMLVEVRKQTGSQFSIGNARKECAENHPEALIRG